MPVFVRLAVIKSRSAENLPFDWYCPSLHKKDEVFKKRTCGICGYYMASITQINEHKRKIHGTAAKVAKMKPHQVSTGTWVGGGTPRNLPFVLVQLHPITLNLF